MNIKSNKKIKIVFLINSIFVYNLSIFASKTSALEENLIAESSPYIQLQFPNLINTGLVAVTTATSGTVTQANSMAVLTTINTNNSNAKFVSRQRLTAQPGQGVSCIFSAIFSTGVANNNQLVGMGNSENGFFFGYNGVSFGVMYRTKITGSVVDTWIPEFSVAAGSSWSSSLMGFNFDPTKGNVYKIQYEAVEFGRVKFLIENQSSGQFELVHELYMENIRTTAFLGNLTMQLMAESINTGASTGLTIKIGSMAGFIEGKVWSTELRHGVSRTQTTGAATTEVPSLSIVNKAVFPDGGPTNQVMMYPDTVSFVVNSGGAANILFTIYLNITPTGGSLVNYDNLTSVAQRNITPTGITADATKVLAKFYVAAGNSYAVNLNEYGMSLSPGETMVISIIPSAATATTVGVALSWTEAF